MTKRKPYGYYSRMKDDELIKYVEQNNRGETLSEFAKSRDQQSYVIALQRGLISTLVEQGILVRAQKPRGFFKNMSNDELIKYVEQTHKGETLSEFAKSRDKQSYVIALQRGLISTMVEQGILVRSQKPRGFFKNMSDDELIKYVEQTHRGKTLIELQKDDSSIYSIAARRGLIITLVEQGILVRTRRPRGFFKNMSDDELIKYTEQHHKGETLSEFAKRRGQQSYVIALQRGLISTMVEQGILVRSQKPRGFFKNMSNEQFIAYVEQNYKGKTLKELAKNENGAYDTARKRGLLNVLVKEGILVREKRYGFFKNMSDDELIKYTEQHHKGETLTKFAGSEKMAYETARKRGLLNVLVKEGILVREKRYGFFKNMSDDELIKYIEQHHKGETLTKFQDSEGSVYHIARQRGLISTLVEQDILVRSQKPRGFFKNMSNDELIKYVEQNHRGKTLSELQKDDSRIYPIAARRGLIDDLVSRGILVRKYDKSNSSINLLEALLEEDGK